MKYIKYILPILVAVSFVAAVCAGVWRFGFPANSSTVEKVDSVWEYTTDSGQQGTVTLPEVLFLPKGTGEIRLTTTLPEWTGEAYALQFISIQQSVEVRIDGEKRYTYGTLPEAADFVYRSAHHINQVVLEQKDSGREVTLIYRAPPLFLPELGHLREMQIGSMNDLTLYRFGMSAPYLIISFFVILTALLSLALLITYRGMPLWENLSILLLAVVAMAFLNSENNALWSVFHHSPVLPAFMDWLFFYIDPLVQFTAWLALYVKGWRLRGIWRWMSVFLGGYLAMTVLSLAGLLNFNLSRPFFSIVGCFFTLFWIKNHTSLQREGDRTKMGFPLSVLVLLAGYYLDYMKYLLTLLPMDASWPVFLQLKLPLQFFTGIASVFFSVIALKETMDQLAKRKADMEVEAETAMLLAEYAKQQYESIVQRDISLRSIKHDMQFYFRTVSAMLADGRIEEARRYVADLGNTVAVLRISPWCADYVANISIGWYADQFAQQGIPFSVDAMIPEVREEVHSGINCILSNALQNALEGCAGQADPFVRLSARPKGKNLVIRIENRCSSKLSEQQDFPTTKYGEGHGLGIAGMKAAAKRQNGYFKASAKEGVFRVDVVLCGVFV